MRGEGRGGGRERSNGGRGGNRASSPLSSPLFTSGAHGVGAVSVKAYYRSQCQDVRGFSVGTLRERCERDSEIEVCLLTGNPINQLVNISLSLSASSFRTISESLGIAHKGGNKFR